MLQVNYAHLPASLRCRRGQPSLRIRAPRKDVGCSPGRGLCTLGRPPPVNQEENRRWGWLIYSHPSTSVLNSRAMRKGNTAWFQHGLGRVSEHPCPRCPPLYRGAHVHPRAPLWEAMSGSVSSSPGAFRSLPSPPPHPTWTLVIYVRVCWGPGESGPRHLGQRWISCFRPRAGLCLGSSEHGAPPEW